MFRFLPAHSLIVTVLIVLFFVPSSIFANSLPAAETVTLEGVRTVSEGTVVVANEDTGTYRVSSSADAATIYGVAVARPPVVYTTENNNVPVITEGIAFVRVTNSNGEIRRGDLLVSSGEEGVAMRASESDQHVFAIALEPLVAGSGVGVIQAEIGSDRAQTLRNLQREQAAAALAETEEDETSFSWVRAVIATMIIVGGLFFVLYSFRSTIAHGVVSVGRNPRAKRSILTLSVANIVFALVLCGVVVFIAVAILVLPL